MTNKDKFIKKANEKFDNKFDYSKFNYINAKTKSIIKCSEHGDFMQTPDKHLQSKFPCPSCLSVHKSETTHLRDKKKQCKSEEDFLKKFKEKHGDFFEIGFEEFEGFTKGTVTLICPIHGRKKVFPKNLLISSHACTECAKEKAIKKRTNKYSECIKRCEEKHKNRYTYLEENELTYKNKKSILNIICHKHGVFLKTAHKHLSGQGCEKCTLEDNIAQGKYPGGYTQGVFDKNEALSLKQGVVYYVKIGECFKIGITTDLNKRMRSLKSISKEDVLLLQTKQTTLYECFLIEQDILEKNKAFRIRKEWSTELFSQDVLKDINIKDSY